MKKEEKYIHETVNGLNKIFVSAGKVGFQIELSPNDLMSVVGCKIADIISDGE